MPLPPSRKMHRKLTFSIAMISLTSLMDMMTIILLFLLKSFSAEGEILAVDPKLKLPVSTSREAPKMRLIIQLTEKDIIVDGVRVVGINEALESQDLSIKPVVDSLSAVTRKTEFLAGHNPSVKFTGEVMIQGNRTLPFTLLKKIMYSCGEAGYGDISLAVMYSD